MRGGESKILETLGIEGSFKFCCKGELKSGKVSSERNKKKHLGKSVA